jgi:hypothetical protein
MNPKSAKTDRPTVKIIPAEKAPGEPVRSPAWGAGQINVTAGASANAFSTATASFAEPVIQKRVDDEWRRWIAENLMVGQPPASIFESMKGAGISAAEAGSEIQAALDSPYIKGSALLLNRLKKRDWLLAVYRKLGRLNPATAEIERRHRLSRGEFLAEYYAANRPVIITGMMDDWPALSKWNLDYFASQFGDREVEVQMGRTAGENYEVEREKFARKVRFGDFVGMIRSAGETNDFYLTANNNSSNRSVLTELWDDVVQIPEYLDPNRPGGFFWMGPKGTVTPFHHDLTNNFMAQVIGRKRVKIAPACDMPLMRNHLHCFSEIDGRVAAPAARPHVDEPQIYDVILNSGEVLFLPIGCLHYVHGIEISVTMSFTNFIFDNDFASFYSTYGPV